MLNAVIITLVFSWSHNCLANSVLLIKYINKSYLISSLLKNLSFLYTYQFPSVTKHGAIIYIIFKVWWNSQTGLMLEQKISLNVFCHSHHFSSQCTVNTKNALEIREAHFWKWQRGVWWSRDRSINLFL